MAVVASHPIVNAWFRAMRRGKAGEDELVALFDAEAEYIEPFGGQARRHVGTRAIRECLREGFEQPPPELSLTIDRVDVDGPKVRAEWTCSSPVFEAPIRGVDEYTLRDGRITRLETSLIG